MENPAIPLEEIQRIILIEDETERQQQLNDLAMKYSMTVVRILGVMKNLIGEEEYFKVFNIDVPKTKLIHFSDLSFCKIKFREKGPFEKEWQKKPYSWDEIQDHISKEKNYGVLCGYEGLIIIDADTEELRKVAEEKLPKTFTVKSGGEKGGMHFYYICPEIKKKIVLQKSNESEDGTKTKHYGEIQSWGAQCVGPGSIHKDTRNPYLIVNNVPIQELTYEELFSTIKPFMTEIKEKEKISLEELEKHKKNQMDKYGESNINNLSMTSVINTSGFKKAANGEYYGPNPWHGSSTGINFWINPQKNVAYCFRCNEPVNVAQAIALNEGIVTSCGEKLSKEQFMTVLNIAFDKYGLKRREINSSYDEIKENQEIRKGFVLLSKFSPKPFAEEIMKRFSFKYDNFKRFWIYDEQSGLWLEDADLFVDKYLRDNLLGDEQQKNNYVNEIISYIRSISWTREIPELLNKNLIAFNNCVVNLDTGDISPLSPNVFITSKVMINLDSKYKECPKIDAFFEKIVGSEKKNILYDLLGYCFLRSYPFQKIFILHGPGQNGKSTYLDLVTRVLGENNISSETPQELATKDFSKGMLWKKFANISSELPYSALGDTNTIKGLCGGDLIKCNRKYKEPFQFKNFAKLIFAGNELPTVNDQTLAWARRLYIIKFDNIIDKPIKNFLDTILTHEELSGLAWKCFQRLMIQKNHNWEFEVSVEPEKMLELYNELSNPLSKFLKEETLEDSEGHIFKYEFRDMFEAWCKQKGYRIWSEVELGKRMKELHEEGKRSVYDLGNSSKRYMAWLGLKWKGKK